jgi:hypothetical protein
MSIGGLNMGLTPTTIIMLAAAGIAGIVAIARQGNVKVIAIVAIVFCVVVAAGAEYLDGRKDAPLNCSQTPAPVINEVCAAGKQCAGGDDFVELKNETQQAIQLACFALQDLRSPGGKAGEASVSRGNWYALAGELPPGQVRAWSSSTLNFSLNKEGDRLFLRRFETPNMNPKDIDSVEIDRQRVYYQRQSGSWLTMADSQVEKKRTVGTFNY